MATLVPLTDLKSRLRIPPTDTEEDVSLQLALDAAELKILDYCRFDKAAPSNRVDTKQLVRLFDPLYLDRRPVVSIVSSTVRMFGDTTGTDVVIDVIDAADGLIRLASSVSWFPPTNVIWGFHSGSIPGVRAELAAYDVLTVTYTTTQTTLANMDARIRDAIVNLGIYFHQMGQRAGLMLSGLSGSQEMYYLSAAMPPWIAMQLSKFAGTHVRVV